MNQANSTQSGSKLTCINMIICFISHGSSWIDL